MIWTTSFESCCLFETKKKKKKRKKNNGLYVSVRSWKPNVIIKNRGIDYLLFYSCILLENSIMAYLV